MEQRPRILIVEDETMIAMLLESMVEDLGYAIVATVAREQDAIDAIQTETIDLAILDVNLGGERSYAIADAFNDRKIPFVFSTGYGESAIESRYREWPILNKPFRKEELAQILAYITKR